MVLPCSSFAYTISKAHPKLKAHKLDIVCAVKDNAVHNRIDLLDDVAGARLFDKSACTFDLLGVGQTG